MAKNKVIAMNNEEGKRTTLHPKKNGYTILQETATDPNSAYTMIRWRDSAITIKTQLSLAEVFGFAVTVESLCFSGDEHVYLPELREFAIRDAIMEYYGCFEMPEDFAERYRIVESNLQLLQKICENVNQEQLDSLVNGTREKMHRLFELDTASATAQMANIASSIATFQEQVKPFLDVIEDGAFGEFVSWMQNGDERTGKVLKSFIDARKAGTDGTSE